METAKQKTQWYFIPIHKTLVVKETDTYTLFNVGNGLYTSILSNKFRRKKEGVNHIYFSLPEKFIVELRHSEQDDKGVWHIIETKEVDVVELSDLVRKDNLALKQG